MPHWKKQRCSPDRNGAGMLEKVESVTTEKERKLKLTEKAKEKLLRKSTPCLMVLTAIDNNLLLEQSFGKINNRKGLIGKERRHQNFCTVCIGSCVCVCLCVCV